MIRPTLSVESLATPAYAGPIDAAHCGDLFNLGWSHYPLTIHDADARRFYEIEATDGGWRANAAAVALTLPQEANVSASKYQHYLPTRPELAAQLESIQKEFSNGEKHDE